MQIEAGRPVGIEQLGLRLHAVPVAEHVAGGIRRAARRAERPAGNFGPLARELRLLLFGDLRLQDRNDVLREIDVTPIARFRGTDDAPPAELTEHA